MADKKPVAFVKPAKPISDMTPEEWEAWKASMFGMIKARIEQPPPDKRKG